MKTSIKVDPSACFFGALLLLTLPLKWLIAAVFAAAFHELCHIILIWFCGGQIWEIRIGIGGAVIETEPLSGGKELVCALAGPVGSLLLLSLFRWFPRIALCAGVQGLFNLLPLFPLDGGRVLRCTAERLLPKKIAAIFCKFTEGATIGSIFLLAILAAVWYQLGLLPVIVAGSLLLKAVLRKIPCKPSQLRVQ